MERGSKVVARLGRPTSGGGDGQGLRKIVFGLDLNVKEKPENDERTNKLPTATTHASPNHASGWSAGMDSVALLDSEFKGI